MYSPNRDANGIRSMITEQEAALAHLDEKIAQLLETRAKETLAITLYHAFHAPIRRLPIDLLGRIFIDCLSDSNSRGAFPTLAAYCVPLTLTAVCRSWREIAIAMPFLWTSLHVGNPIGRRLSSNLLRAALDRSGDHPLNISINLKRFGGRDHPADPYYEQIIPFLPRVRILKLEMGRHAGVPSLPIIKPDGTNSGSSAVPHLEIFEYRSSYDMVVIGEEKEAEINTFLQNAPHLHSFFWKNDDNHRAVPPCMLRIPWSQLAHLQLCRMLSINDILGILTQTPLLETCAFGFLHLPSVIPTNSATLVLTRLQSFHIQTSRDPGPLFDCLTLPALHAFSVVFNDEKSGDGQLIMPSWPQMSFEALLFRSKCSLARLRLCMHIAERDLFSCMQRVNSTLKELHVIGVYEKTRVTHRFFKKLTATPTGECLCPLLQEVLLKSCDTSSFSQEALQKLMESRLALVSNLEPLLPHRFMEIEHTSNNFNEKLPAIHDFLAIKGGMKLYMDYFPAHSECGPLPMRVMCLLLVLTCSATLQCCAS